MSHQNEYNVVHYLHDGKHKGEAYPVTTYDNVRDRFTRQTLDWEIEQIKLRISQLQRYVTPQKLDFSFSDNFVGTLNCYRLGDMMFVCGNFRIKGGVTLSNNTQYVVGNLPYYPNITSDEGAVRFAGGIGDEDMSGYVWTENGQIRIQFQRSPGENYVPINFTYHIRGRNSADINEIFKSQGFRSRVRNDSEGSENTFYY